MANPFEVDPRDVRLMVLLHGGGDGPQPSDIEEARRLYGERAMEARPFLVRKARSYGVRNAEYVVDEAMSRGFEYIVNQFQRVPVAFAYRGPMSIPTWISLIQNLLQHSHRRREHRDDLRQVPIEDANPVAAPESSFEDEIALSLAGKGVAELEGNERFVIEAQDGLLENVKFDRSGIFERCARASFSPEDTAAIWRRAKAARIDPNANALQDREIALLLDVSIKTVERARQRALSRLQGPFREAAE